MPSRFPIDISHAQLDKEGFTVAIPPVYKGEAPRVGDRAEIEIHSVQEDEIGSATSYTSFLIWVKVEEVGSEVLTGSLVAANCAALEDYLKRIFFLGQCISVSLSSVRRLKRI